MRVTSNIVGFLILATMGGCVHQPPVNLSATPADREMLVGQWQGEYESPALGRRGTIEFTLVAGEGNAHGDVVMIPQGAAQPYGPASLGHSSDTPSSPVPQVLDIEFVHSASGEVMGALKPYWDPDRNCQASTAFRGNLTTGTINGTFTTTFACGTGQASGTWHVTRKPARQAARSSVN